MVFDTVSFILGGLIFGILAWALQSYLNRTGSAQQTHELSDLKKQVVSARLDSERTSDQMFERTKQLAALETANVELKTRLPKLEGFERANADLRVQMQGFDNIKHKLETAETELTALRLKAAEFDGLNSKLEGVQTELSVLKSKTAGFEGVQAKAALTTELEGKIAALEIEKTAQLKEVATAVLKASDAEAAQLKLRASLQESVAEVARTRAGMQQFEGLKARIDELEARGISNETQAKLDSLETELSAYKNRVTQLETASNNELEALKARVRQFEAEIEAKTVAVVEQAVEQVS